MLSLLNNSIIFNKSYIFRRLIILVYTGALTVLYFSSWSIILKFLITVIFFYQIVIRIYNPQPHHYRKLIYRPTAWILEDHIGRKLVYTKIKVIISTGLFFLLALSNNNKKRKIIVVFTDQISKTDYLFIKIANYT